MVNKIIRFALLFFLIIVFSTCYNFKTNTSTGAPGDLYEEFYVSPNLIQYYINPLKYKGDQNSKLTIDFSFRDYGLDTTKVIANYSVYTKNLLKIDSTSILVKNQIINLKNNKKLFIEKGNNKYTIRQSGILYYSELKKFLQNTSTIIVYLSNNDSLKFKATNRTIRRKKKLYNRIIKMIDFNKS